VGFYARHVLPPLIDLAMRGSQLSDERRRIVPLARGRVIEIGFGSGLNLPFYGSEVKAIAAVDPSSELWSRARSRVARAPFRIEFTHASAERLPFDAAAFDTAVSTWTLCSIPDVAAALREIHRVLVPGGRLLFVEHGRAPDPSVRAWQERITPAWRRIAGGCHVTRPIADLVTTAGFRITQLDQSYAPGPRVFTYLYRGVAAR
jgi:ubiquinone/menaquinone biosynthesis C-methylase UbiE